MYYPELKGNNAPKIMSCQICCTSDAWKLLVKYSHKISFEFALCVNRVVWNQLGSSVIRSCPGLFAFEKNTPRWEALKWFRYFESGRGDREKMDKASQGEM